MTILGTQRTTIKLNLKEVKITLTAWCMAIRLSQVHQYTLANMRQSESLILHKACLFNLVYNTCNIVTSNQSVTIQIGLNLCKTVHAVAHAFTHPWMSTSD